MMITRRFKKALRLYLGENGDICASSSDASLFSGHPRTQAFVTHGGANGLYEAVYHGVPLFGIPLFSDQPDN